MTTYECPVCIEPNSVRRSRARAWEGPLGLLGIYPFRCKACSKRFHRRWQIPVKALAETEFTPLLASLKNASFNHASLPEVLIDSVPVADVSPLLRTNELLICVAAPRVTNQPPAASAAEQPARRWTLVSPAFGYAFKSFAALLLLHFVVGNLEYGPLGKAAMWVNVLTLITLVGALLVFIHLEGAKRGPFEAVCATAVLVLWWTALFFATEVFYGLILGPGGRGFSSAVAFYREQSPWIGMTFVALPVAGGVGGLVHFVCNSIPNARR